MADVSFRIRADGAPEAVGEVNKVRTALGGVETSLDSNAVASRASGAATQQMSEAQKAAAAAVTGAVAPTQNWTATLRQLGLDTLPIPSNLSRIADAATQAGTGVAGFAAQLAIGATVGAFTAAALVATAVLTGWISLGRDLGEAQNQANAALRNMDFSAIQSGLKKSGEALDEYQDNWDRALTDMTGQHSTFAERQAARWSAIQVLWQQAKGGQDGLTAAVDEWAKKSELAWNSFGRGKLEMQAFVAGLDAANARLVLQRETIGTVEELGQSYVKQAANIRAAADAKANQAVLEALAEDQMLRRRGLIEQADQRMALIAQKAAEDRAKAYVDADAKELDGRRQVMEIVTKQFENEATLANLRGKLAIQTVQQQQEEVNARQAAAQAWATYYGTSAEGLEVFQARRRASIEQTGQLELTRLNDVYQAERAGLQARLDSGLLTVAQQQTVSAQITRLDLEAQIARQAATASTNKAIIEDTTRTVQEIVAAYTARIQLATAEFGVLRASGQASVTDEVNFAAARATAYREGSKQRIDAETEFANKVKGLNDSLVSAGDRLTNLAIESLQKQGYEYTTQAQQQREILRLKDAALLTEQNVAAGIAQSNEAQKASKDFAAAWAAAVATGASPVAAIGASFEQWRANLSDSIPTTTDLVSRLTGLGVPLEAARAAAQQLANENERYLRDVSNIPDLIGASNSAMDRLRTSTDNAASSAAEIGNQLRASRLFELFEGNVDLFAGFGSNTTQGLAAIDNFYAQAEIKIDTGNSRLANKVYSGVGDALVAMIDDEAARS